MFLLTLVFLMPAILSNRFMIELTADQNNMNF